MPTETKTQTLQQDGWVLRLKQEKTSPTRILLLLHGWTGDEESLWRLTSKLPDDYLILAPRAPYSAKAEAGGYSWREIKPNTWGSPTLKELRLSADTLVSLVDLWLASVKSASPRFDMIGFSQGGALAATIAALHPARVHKAAVLSGFIPAGAEELLHPHLFDGTRFFWSHGKKDEMIPFSRGMKGAKLLKEAGAKVDFCTSDLGHRVGKKCRRALNTFFSPTTEEQENRRTGEQENRTPFIMVDNKGAFL